MEDVDKHFDVIYKEYDDLNGVNTALSKIQDGIKEWQLKIKN